jgi:hypothetical protein
MCYSAGYSFFAFSAIQCVSFVYRKKLQTDVLLFNFYWSLMELLQGLGYLYPNNVYIPYLLMIHTITQPLMYFTNVVTRKHNSSIMFEKYRYIYILGAVNLCLFIPRFFSTHILPCNETFCSLMNDPTPRCVVLPKQHMTWSVPMGYTFNEIYITPTVYTHFQLFFVFSFLVNPKKTMIHFVFVLFIKLYLLKTTNDIYVDSSIVASIWCYLALFIGKIGIHQILLDLIPTKVFKLH